METIQKVFIDGGVPAWVILAMGAVAVGIIVERFKALYSTYAFKGEDFILKVENLLLADRIGEAITFCAAHNKSPLADVVKSVLERANRDDQSIQQAQEVKLGAIVPKLGERIGYLAMIANVATLVGLLGTITGLIMSFEAVSFADPSQKQMLLSQGISMAMNTTALGLSVAIPVMIFYAILNARQNALTESLVSLSSRIVDHMTNRHYTIAQPQQQQAMQQQMPQSLQFPNGQAG